LLVSRIMHQRDYIGQDALTAAPHLGFVEGLISLPELLRLHAAEAVARLLDGLGQFLDLVVTQPLLIGTAVEHLQSGDLILVALDELLKGLYQRLRAVAGVAIERCLSNPVLADGVDDLLVALADFNNPQAELRAADDGPNRITQNALSRGGNFRLTRLILAGGLPRRCKLHVGI